MSEEQKNPEWIDALTSIYPDKKLGWPDLLGHRCVLLLAEAGSGKTCEMREQTARLLKAGKQAFFVSIESLDKDDLINVFSAIEQDRFEAWKTAASEPGQYLRHEHCRAGCLLLTYNGSRSGWQHPQSADTLTFEQGVAYLNEIAISMEKQSNIAIRLAVLGLDLRSTSTALPVKRTRTQSR